MPVATQNKITRSCALSFVVGFSIIYSHRQLRAKAKGSLWVYLGPVVPLRDPRTRRGDRGSGFARAWKPSQALTVGGVSLDVAPAARQDDAETASIIVNGGKGLCEHGHRGGPAITVSNGASTWYLEFILGGKVHQAIAEHAPAMR